MVSRVLSLLTVVAALTVFASHSALAHEGTHEGKVVKTSAGKLTLAVAAKGEAKANTRTMDVAANATITLDDKPAKLDDLKEGFHAKVTNDAKHVLTKIEAHSKDK